MHSRPDRSWLWIRLFFGGMGLLFGGVGVGTYIYTSNFLEKAIKTEGEVIDHIDGILPIVKKQVLGFAGFFSPVISTIWDQVIII